MKGCLMLSLKYRLILLPAEAHSMKTALQTRQPQPPPEVLLRVGGLHYTYAQDSAPVLSDVNFYVRKRSITALIGRSGGGKTTLFNILCGFITPTSGWCYIKDAAISSPSAERIPIFQEDGLWPWLNTIQNVTLAHLLCRGRLHARSAEQEAAEILQSVGISKNFHHTYTKHLSTGMKKRVELARALIARPAMLLADEPFASIDSNAKSTLHDLLLSLWEKRGLTIFLSTHDLHEAMYLASDILILTKQGDTSIIERSVKNPFQGKKRAVREETESYFRFYDHLHSRLFNTHEESLV